MHRSPVNPILRLPGNIWGLARRIPDPTKEKRAVLLGTDQLARLISINFLIITFTDFAVTIAEPERRTFAVIPLGLVTISRICVRQIWVIWEARIFRRLTHVDIQILEVTVVDTQIELAFNGTAFIDHEYQIRGLPKLV